MPYYRRRELPISLNEAVTQLSGVLSNAVDASPRGLKPFPGVAGDAARGLADALTDAAASTQNTLPESLVQQASTAVPRAAAILDEEMARGLLSARALEGGPLSAPALNNPPLSAPALKNSSLSAPALNAAPTPLLADVQQFVQRVAGLLTRADQDDRPPMLHAAAVPPGHTATVAMRLENTATMRKSLTPHATDLLGDSGGRIPSPCVEFSQGVVTLQQGEHAQLTLSVRVPAETTPGDYFGLVVINGAADLRAVLHVPVQLQTTG